MYVPVENHLCPNRRYVSPLCSGHLGLRKQIPQGNVVATGVPNPWNTSAAHFSQTVPTEKRSSVGVGWAGRIWSLRLLLCFPSKVDWQTSVASPPCLHPTLGLVTLCLSLREKIADNAPTLTAIASSGACWWLLGGWGEVVRLHGFLCSECWLSKNWPHLCPLSLPRSLGSRTSNLSVHKPMPNHTHQG